METKHTVEEAIKMRIIANTLMDSLDTQSIDLKTVAAVATVKPFFEYVIALVEEIGVPIEALITYYAMRATDNIKDDVDDETLTKFRALVVDGKYQPKENDGLFTLGEGL